MSDEPATLPERLRQYATWTEYDKLCNLLKEGADEIDRLGKALELRNEEVVMALKWLPPEKLWLWKNGDHFLAYAHLYPCKDGGDPLVLGEPVGYALLKPSTPPATGPHKDDKP